jgi:hypothetical protein
MQTYRFTDSHPAPLALQKSGIRTSSHSQFSAGETFASFAIEGERDRRMIRRSQLLLDDMKPN